MRRRTLQFLQESIFCGFRLSNPRLTINSNHTQTCQVVGWNKTLGRLEIVTWGGMDDYWEAVHFLTCIPCWSDFFFKRGNVSYPTTENTKMFRTVPLALGKLFIPHFSGIAQNVSYPFEKKRFVCKVFIPPKIKRLLRRDWYGNLFL